MRIHIHSDDIQEAISAFEAAYAKYAQILERSDAGSYVDQAIEDMKSDLKYRREVEAESFDLAGEVGEMRRDMAAESRI